MQAKLTVTCGQCGKHLGAVSVDTALMPDELQERVNKVILAHRQDCQYYRTESLSGIVKRRRVNGQSS